MTLQETFNLMSQLTKEIKEGKDVEFNKQWLEILKKKTTKAVNKAFSKALK